LGGRCEEEQAEGEGWRQALRHHRALRETPAHRGLERREKGDPSEGQLGKSFIRKNATKKNTSVG